MSDLVQARWKCGYPVEMPGQGIVAPGAVALVTAGEAESSDNWERVEAPKTKQKGDA